MFGQKKEVLRHTETGHNIVMLCHLVSSSATIKNLFFFFFLNLTSQSNFLLKVSYTYKQRNE